MAGINATLKDLNDTAIVVSFNSLVWSVQNWINHGG